MTLRSLVFRAISALSLLVFAAATPSAHGQAAPQLLPYQTSLVAGGSSTTFTAGATCPLSGYTSLDAFGDGCLATEVALSAPRYITKDTNGNIFLSDSGHALIRRIDAATGVITAYAGGAAANPASGATCGAFTSTDWQGDGCLATSVMLKTPLGVAISPLNGNLYFSDSGNSTVRMVDKTTGIVTNVAGNTSGTASVYGYASGVVANSSDSYLDYVAGIQFDSHGNLYVPDNGKQAIMVVNTSSAPTTVTGITIQPGYIQKVMGYATGADCTNGSGSTSGCKYGTWVNGQPATSQQTDSVYDALADSTGRVIFPNQYNAILGVIDTAGIINTYAGATSGTETNKHGTATTLKLGNSWGLAIDSLDNVYFTDSLKGWIWRVDAAGNGYVVAGGATSVCSAATDASGDGCPATQAKFSSAASGTYTNTLYLSGVYVDTANTLYLANTTANLVHKFTTNTDFGIIQPPAVPTQTLAIHFGIGDGPAASAYTLTTGAADFTLGSATCTANADNTTDCLLPVTVSATAPTGALSSTLHVVSTAGKTADFTLTGTLTQDQVDSRTVLTATPSATTPTTVVTLHAKVSSSISAVTPGTGTVSFYNGTTLIGTTQTLDSDGTASVTYTFPVGTYQITAVYSGNAKLNASTSPVVTVVSSLPGFTVTPTIASQTIVQGQYALNTLTVASVGGYTGDITFACTGLPTNSSCVFSPSTVTIGSAPSTVTLTIKTQSTTSASVAIPAMPGSKAGSKVMLALLPGAALLLFGLRRKMRTRLPTMLLLALSCIAAIGMVGCSEGTRLYPPTPAGAYTVTVTATGTPTASSTAVMSLTITK